jgi:serine protease Do
LAGLPQQEGQPGDGPGARLGLAVAPLDELTRRRRELPPDITGVVVQSVDPASDAARKGLRSGDVIVRVNERRIARPSDLADAVAAASSSGRTSVLVFVHRERGRLAVPVRLIGAKDDGRPAP